MLDNGGRAQAYVGTLEVQSAWMQGSRDHARKLAREALERWPEYFSSLEKFTQEQLVFRIDAARGERLWSDEETHISYEEEQRVQTFLLARYEPQTIAGVATLFAGPHIIREALERDIPA